MSFSRRVKEELAKQASPARHCQLAEFAAIFALAGKIRQSHDKRYYLEIHTENLTVAQKSYMLIRRLFQTSIDVKVRNHNLQGSAMNYYLIVQEPKMVIAILKAIKLMDDQGKIQNSASGSYMRLVQNACCKRAFLRGVFLMAGSVTNPEKAYHLELAVLSKDFAVQLQKMMSFFEIDAKIVERKKYQVVYVKEGAQIVDFLNVVEAHVALMEFENIRIVKEVRNSVNRQVNCETANISKTVAAAAKQIEDIKYIECNMGLRQLVKGLREIAELRLEYPDSSLQELGQMLNPPIGKSGVNHRLRKIGNIANQLREEKIGINPLADKEEM